MATVRVGVMAVGMVLAACVPAAPAWGADAERDYWRAMAAICSTGVTPAIVEAHRALTAALDKERRPAETFLISGSPAASALVRRVVLVRAADMPWGPATNFWGPPRPEHAYALCVQAR